MVEEFPLPFLIKTSRMKFILKFLFILLNCTFSLAQINSGTISYKLILPDLNKDTNNIEGKKN